MKGKILVVDDEEDNIELARAVLSGKGFETITFNSGKEAIAYLKECDSLPDLMILDMRMPEMSGIDVCTELRKDERLNGLKIVFFTASSDLDSSIVKRFNAMGFIYKPFDIHQLVDQINRYIQQEPPSVKQS